MNRRHVGMLVGALLLGAAVALPVGMMLGGNDDAATPEPAPRASAAARAVYSPKVLSDPYFIEQQRKGIEALEQRCRDAGEFCDEAREGRRWLDDASR